MPIVSAPRQRGGKMRAPFNPWCSSAHWLTASASPRFDVLSHAELPPLPRETALRRVPGEVPALGDRHSRRPPRRLLPVMIAVPPRPPRADLQDERRSPHRATSLCLSRFGLRYEVRTPGRGFRHLSRIIWSKPKRAGHRGISGAGPDPRPCWSTPSPLGKVALRW